MRPDYGYDTHSYCRRCEQWFDKEKYKRCPVHGRLLRTTVRQTRVKREERWAGAY